MLTPGRLILELPLNDTPPIFLAVCNIVAEEALPVILALTLPVPLGAVSYTHLTLPTIYSV